MAVKTLTKCLTNFLADKAVERHEKYQTSEVNEWPLLSAQETQVYLGAFSWTLPFAHMRLIYRPTAVYPFGLAQTPGELVRDYLDWKFPKRLRCTSAQYDAIMYPRSFPRMAHKGRIESAAYLDIKSAYWSIISAVGWNVDYFPGHWIGVSSDLWDFPLQGHKAARSALVTAGLSSPVRMWDHGKLSWCAAENRHINYGLWALVQDVLHGVADDMVLCGAEYVHTDGYIIPGDKVDQAIQAIRSWGLNFSVKAAGPAEIRGIGVYKVGSKVTKRQEVLPVRDHVHIEPHFKDWLRERFSIWAQRAHKRS